MIISKLWHWKGLIAFNLIKSFTEDSYLIFDIAKPVSLEVRASVSRRKM